ncbi:MAG TPA: isopeptide-forming domain-containing fimbrial protein, partial [Thermoanaerobaculia bacterium]|nr:isopeptide-forming domain-containing fimbrial protein [Thermoanaerobaculia bacterium]
MSCVRRFAGIRAFLALVLLLPPSFSEAAVDCATPGRDGSGSLSGVVNTYWPGTATAAAGANSITLGAARGAPAAQTPIASGDLLLVIQMQDAAINSTNTDSYGDGAAGGSASGWTSPNNSGKYEYVKATGALPVAGGVLTIQGTGAGSGLLNTYTNADATATQGQRRFQVVRVPQYSSATLTSGLTAAAWNGATGGVLAIDVSGALDLAAATVSVDGLGFRGGGARQVSGDTGGADTDYVQSSAKNFDGAKGEGAAGTPNWIYDVGSGTTISSGTDYPNNNTTIDGGLARGAPGNAGGGGTDGRPSNNDRNSGGGGGGNGGAGGHGGFTWNTELDRGGYGGVAFTAAATAVVLGGGGGAGTRNNSAGAVSSGAAGGGIVMFRV